jgi:hypothetical protein
MRLIKGYKDKYGKVLGISLLFAFLFTAIGYGYLFRDDGWFTIIITTFIICLVGIVNHPVLTFIFGALLLFMSGLIFITMPVDGYYYYCGCGDNEPVTYWDYIVEILMIIFSGLLIYSCFAFIRRRKKIVNNEKNHSLP